MTGVVLAFAFLLTTQAPSPAGAIKGCVSDTTQPLPRATITATGAGVKRTTTGDASGCYEFRDMPLGAYRVTARLRGFNNVTHDRVAVTGGTVTQLDFSTRPSPICECIQVAGPTLVQQWNYADAVVHVRLSDTAPGPAARAGYYRHVATLLNALKLPSGSALRSPMSILQNQEHGLRDPYDVGQEAVLFLKSWDGEFFITDDNPGYGMGIDAPPAIAFLIQDGRIVHAPPGFSGYVGERIAMFLDELRALSRRQ